jgi:low affinity Fe/Cu permease
MFAHLGSSSEDARAVIQPRDVRKTGANGRLTAPSDSESRCSKATRHGRCKQTQHRLAIGRERVPARLAGSGCRAMGELQHHRTALKRGNARQRKLRSLQSKLDQTMDSATQKSVGELHKQHVGRARASSKAGSGPFRKFAQAVSTAAGRPWTFVGAVALIIVWGVSGPLFDFSDTWQLVINTTTTIVTFLMVFLIQNTQNRDTEALRLKLDELILATRAARNEFVKIEDLSDEDLDRLEKDLKAGRQSGGSDDESDDD